jgi:membrane protein implicated in regulation of membrane protease activity
MEYYQLSIIAGIILIIIEMITLTFIFLGFGIGAFAVSMIQFLLDDVSIGRDSIVFAVFSLISIVIFRKLFKSNSDQKKLMEEDVNQY